MDQEAIKKILPHRDNMLLVQEAEVVDGVAHAKYHVSGDEWFLKGHFPWQSGRTRRHPLRDDGAGRLRAAG